MRTSAGIPRTARRPFSVTPAAQRSAIGNGSRLLEHLDARSAPARRYRDLQADIVADLGGEVATSMMQLIRSASGLVVLRERLDERVLAGEAIDASEYCRISNSLRRICESIGLHRVPRDVSDLSVDQYREMLGRERHEHDEAPDAA